MNTAPDAHASKSCLNKWIKSTGHPKTKDNVLIGNDVWIGTVALIFSGVTIGDGAVVGTRPIVTPHTYSSALIVGNPAKVVKFRFDEETIERLLALKWWEWGDAQIERAMPEMLNYEITLFREKAERGDY